MALLKVVSAVLGAGSAGLAIADRMSAAPPPAPDTKPVDLGRAFPSQSESAAALGAHLGTAHERTRLGAG